MDHAVTASPTILAFDTSAAHCAAALLQGGAATVRIDEMARGQGEHLMGMLEEMLAAAGLVWADLDGIGVGVGPGNFTGIRISVSAARGLALGLGVPAIGVSQLEAQVFGMPGSVVSCLSAPRDMGYVQVFSEARAITEPALSDLTLKDLPALSGSQIPCVVGSCSDRIAVSTGWRTVAPLLPPIEAVARLAALRLNDSRARPAPLYVRPADAAPPKLTAPQIV